jgi:uncharacterized protein YqeY
MRDLQTQLNDDLKVAMRARDEVRRDTIRFLNSALKYAKIAAMRELSDDEVQGVLIGQIKQRRDSIEQFKAAGRTDLSDKEEAELAILASYLPAPPSDDEVSASIEKAIRSTGASGVQDMGKVVRAIVDRYPGGVDGKVVAARVREALSSKH